MGTGRGANKRDCHIGDRALRKIDFDLVLPSIGPVIRSCDCEAGLDTTVGEVWRDIYFDTIFLWINLQLA